MILGFDVGPATAPWLRAAGLALLHFVWVGAAIGGLAGIARRRMSAASPEARYRAAAGWLVAMAAAPVLLLAVFAILALGDFDAASGVLGSTRDAAAAMPVDRAVDGGAEGGAVPIADRGSSAARAFDALLMFVPGVWAAGALIKHALLLLGWSATARWRREARPVDDPQLERALRRWSRALGITKEVAIAWSDRVVTPVLVGVVRPMVLLPATLATGWIPERLEMVLLHELAHVHRRDLLVQWGQRVVEGLLFFHPEVFRISRWLSLERERCCDALVVRHARGSVESYVHTLVALADDRRGGPARGVRAALADRQLVSRIRTLLHREEIPMRSTSVPAITAALVALGFALSGTVTSRACPPEERVAPAAPVPPAAPLAPSARMPVAPSARVTEWFAPAVPVPPTPPSAVSPPSAVPPPAAPKSPVWKQPPVPPRGRGWAARRGSSRGPRLRRPPGS